MANKNQQASKSTTETEKTSTDTAPSEKPRTETTEESTSQKKDGDIQAADSEKEDEPKVSGSSGSLVASSTDKVGTKTPVEAIVAAKTQEKADAAAAGLMWSLEAQEHIGKLNSSSAKNGFDELSNYLVAMAPGKPVSPDQISRNQVSLWRTIQLLINQSGDEFPIVFGILLKIFHEHVEGALGGTYVFRGTEHITIKGDDLQGFLRILNILVHMADPKAREVAGKTSIDFNRSLQYGITEQARSAILAYFGK